MKTFIIFVIIISKQMEGLCQLLTWNFTGQPGDQITQNSSASAPGIGIGVLSRGNGVEPHNSSNTFTTRSWFEAPSNMDEVVEQITENDYCQFTLPIETGYIANITSIVISLTASNTGPEGATLRYDINDYTTDLGSTLVNGTLTANINQNSIPSGTITFRLYGTRTSSGGTSSGTLRMTSLTINGTTTVLPIELTKFTANNVELQAILSWQTASELNFSHFSIEKSTDGTNFREIGSVPGNGTTHETHNYEFIDKYPSPGTNYYRLRQVDLDGKFEYSKVVSVNFSNGTNTVLFPTLVKEAVNFRFYKPTVEVVILWVFDIGGRLVHQQPIESETELLSVSTDDLMPGHYLARLQFGRTMENLRFVKQ